MKYGEQFEKESVPQWSLYNIDYNSLKHHIKAHTTRDQATAIAIPGHKDTALSKFETGFYDELCRQHDRVDLFVTSKADEISRRLQHLSNQIHRLIVRCATSGQSRTSLKQQRRFARYEQVLLQCGDDIRSLQRFVNAQIVAFRKILKKYRKWTGSSTLGLRFRDCILSHPKSFTRRDFSQLQSQYDDLKSTLEATTPTDASGLASPAGDSSRSRQQSPTATIVDESQPTTITYWNEYDCGSETGDYDRGAEGDYAIYIDPNDDLGFPGMKAIGALFVNPVKKLNAWMSVRSLRSQDSPDSDDLEQGPLLPAGDSTLSPYGSTHSKRSATSQPSYFTIPPGWSHRDANYDGNTDQDAHNNRHHSRRGSSGYASSEEQFPTGYQPHYAALPSIDEQRMAQYRERVLFWGTWGCYAVAFVLMGIATVLITAGRNKKRLEVDAGVTLGIMTSLGLACAAICMAGSRQGSVSWPARLAAWVAFAVVCAANGILLVLVMGNSPI
ncbi:SPX domain-containing protein [Podospora australis]|uniref:SPX domain-containing protein n=1 Tax=Podospora australis TaxID=1536484 RepID=A0AAN7AM32_9PEZI|nr:SPX domain-containing protein [Podospora australis]